MSEDKRSVWDELTDLSPGWTLNSATGAPLPYVIDVRDRLPNNLPRSFFGASPEEAAQRALAGVRDASTIADYQLAHARCEGLIELLASPGRIHDRMRAPHSVGGVREAVKALRDGFAADLAEMGHPIIEPEPLNGNVQTARPEFMGTTR